MAIAAPRGSAVPLVWISLLSVSHLGRLGILIARHLKRLERVILGYLEVCDGPEEEARLGILETLQSTIEHAWPRYRSRGERRYRTCFLCVQGLYTPSDGHKECGGFCSLMGCLS